MKHKWGLSEDGEIDIFALDVDCHNGPKCEVCGFSFCHHCHPEYYDLDDCPGKKPLVEMELTCVNKIPQSDADNSKPDGAFVKGICVDTGLSQDVVSKVIRWLHKHNHVGIKKLMCEINYTHDDD